MTTAAAFRGVMAADTQLTGNGVVFRVQKLFRLPDGGVASGAGDWGKCYAALKWLSDGEKGECPTFEDSSLLILRPDGSIWIADDLWPAYPLLDEFAAIGSGQQAAQAAMRAGKSAEQAVRVAIGVDNATSDPVQTMRVRKK